MPDFSPNFTLPFPILVQSEDVESALPLERTRVTVQITGPAAAVVVTQRFTNPLKEPAELDYLFPLPEEAAIYAFEVNVGTWRITGDLQELDAARGAYEEAKGQGRRTGLFEQRRPNLFAVRLANILPGEAIDVTVRYQQRVKYSDGVYEFVYPMGLTPKFDRPGNAREGEGVHAPVALGGEKIGPVEIEVVVDAGLPVGDPLSPSHPLETLRIEDRLFQVRLSGEHIPDHDFVLRYPLAAAEVTAAGWTSGEPGQEYFLASVVPPRLGEDLEVPPREFIFVLDRSGSMTGEPIAQARNALRACLRSLNPRDTFRLLLFDNALEWYTQAAVSVTQEQVEQADAYLAQVQGRGGTEIIKAIEAVLTLEPDPGRTRFVVFLTDGAVSAEAQALEQVRGKIGPARLFTFGVGPSVNRALLSRMARLGRGRSVFLQLDEDIEGAIIQFQDSVSFPVLTNLSMRWENGKAWDVYPARLPDLYFGQPLEISGRLARTSSPPARAVLRGERLGQAVELYLNLNLPTGRDLAIERVWAQARVEDLLEQIEIDPSQAQKIRSEIVGLAIEFNLVTPYTSFVAIDQGTARSGGTPRVVHVAQPLPKGLAPLGFIGGQPVMHTLGMGMITPAAFAPQAPSGPVAAAAKSTSNPLRALLARMVPERSQEDPAQSLYAVYSGSKGGAQPPVMPMGSAQGDALSTLRWLARIQNLNGSWGDDVEWTAAALLAFIRAGNTTRIGSYRQAMRRAVKWLADHPGAGVPAFARVRALEELAQATGEERDKSLAQEARLALPAPSTLLERAALGESIAPPAAVGSLDDLRLAVFLRIRRDIPRNLLRGEKGDLGSTWAAALYRKRQAF